MRVVLTLGRSAPPYCDAVYLDFKRHEVSRGKERVKLWPGMFRMVSAILASGQIDTPALIDHMMSEREDGGPEDIRRYIRVCANRARKKLAPLGIAVRGEYSYGYRAIDLWQERARAA